LGALNASGTVIPGWPGNTINIGSPALATGFSKPALILQALQDSILTPRFDSIVPISKPNKSYPIIQGILNNQSTGATFLLFVTRANHFNLHSGSTGTYYFHNLLNPLVHSQEEPGTHMRLLGTTGLGISSYTEINFMNKYLKNQNVALTNLQKISSAYPDVSVIIFKL
jgi:hypothetical protein